MGGAFATATFSGATFSGATFTGATFTVATFSATAFSAAPFAGAGLGTGALIAVLAALPGGLGAAVLTAVLWDVAARTTALAGERLTILDFLLPDLAKDFTAKSFPSSRHDRGKSLFSHPSSRKNSQSTRGIDARQFSAPRI
jgi:uncharacterized protein YjbI with pentapeptide repeats